jgi:hypothetical protein
MVAVPKAVSGGLLKKQAIKIIYCNTYIIELQSNVESVRFKELTLLGKRFLYDCMEEVYRL